MVGHVLFPLSPSRGKAPMGLTQHGPRCDVCGNYILPLDPEERINMFNVTGIKEELMADNNCRKLLEGQ
jgi:hypothetical protein